MRWGTTEPVVGEAAELDTETPAVVLKLDANVMHHGGLGVIRSLGRLGVPVYGVQERRLAPAASSRYLYGRWLWRPDPDNVERVRDGLLRLADRIGRPAVLIPTDDAGAIFLAERGADLRDRFLFSAPPADLPRRLAGKFSLSRLCAELGVPCPETIQPRSAAEARAFAARVGYPVVAKLGTPWQRPVAGLRSTAILHDAEDLVRCFAAADGAGAELLLQRFVPGGPGHDWFFHGYCATDGGCRPAFTGVKDRSYPPHAGLTSFGRALDNPALRRTAVDLLGRLGFRGIVDLDFRRDADTGRYLLLDFNPRIGAQFRLFRDATGLDVVLAAYRDLTGQPVPAQGPTAGRGFLVENYDPIAALGYWRGGQLSLTSWLASLRAADEAAWFARDDLAPFGLMCLRMGWRALTRRWSRGRATFTEPRYRPGRAAVRDPGRQPVSV